MTMSKYFYLFLGFILSLFGVSAYATDTGMAAVDVSGVVSTLTNQVTSISGIGIAVLTLVGIVTAFAFIRKSASGR